MVGIAGPFLVNPDPGKKKKTPPLVKKLSEWGVRLLELFVFKNVFPKV